MTSPTRILLIDDQTTIRQALQMLLEREPGFEIVGGAADGKKGIALAESLEPDVILVDIEMPGMDGIETTRVLKERFPEINILILTGQDDQSCLQRALQAGAKGYLLKTTPAEDLTYAIRSVQKGYSQVSPGLIEKLMSQAAPEPAPAPAASVATREPQLVDRLPSLQDLNRRCRVLQARIKPVAASGNDLDLRLTQLGFHRDRFFQWQKPEKAAIAAPSSTEQDIPTAAEFVV